MAAAKKTPALKAATLEQLQASREVVAFGPSGQPFKIRPLDMQRYALANYMPNGLRQIAALGSDGIAQEAMKDEISDERAAEILKTFDAIVRALVIEPDLSGVESLDDVLHPQDLNWLIGIANGQEHDGEGRRLWGREPLSSFGLFREKHGCNEDCASCLGVVDAMASRFAGRNG